jgi:hypothetical protein
LFARKRSDIWFFVKKPNSRANSNTTRNDTGTATIHSSRRIHHGTCASVGPRRRRDDGGGGAAGCGDSVATGELYSTTGITRVAAGDSSAAGAGGA